MSSISQLCISTNLQKNEKVLKYSKLCSEMLKSVKHAAPETMDPFYLENEDIEYIPVVHLFDPRATRRLQYG